MLGRRPLSRLAHHYDGLAAVYADEDIPPGIQALIDDVFAGPDRRRARRITPGDVVDRAGYETEMLEGSATSITADTSAVTRGLQRNSPVMRDIEKLYAAITYVRAPTG